MLIYRLSIKTYYPKEIERRSARHNTVSYLCRLCPFTSDPSARGDFCLGLLTTQYYIQQHCTVACRRTGGGSSVTARRGGVRRRALAFIGAQLLQQFYQSYCAVYSGRYIKKNTTFSSFPPPQARCPFFLLELNVHGKILKPVALVVATPWKPRTSLLVL